MAFLALTPVSAQGLTLADANPNYFYDRETAFIISHAIDPTIGGAYTALEGDGDPYGDLQGVIWGIDMNDPLFGNNRLQGTDRSFFGQGTCIRWFITEYQRVTDPEGNGIAGINAVLTANGQAPLLSPAQLLNYGASCADFVINNMVINRVDDSIAEDPYNGTFAAPQVPDIGDVTIPGRVYYWTSVGLTPTGERTRYVDDTLDQIALSGGAPRAESIVPWSIAELGRAMNAAGLNGARFIAHGQAYWNWYFNVAGDMPDYNTTPDQTQFPDDYRHWQACGDATPVNRCLVGAARGAFVPALGMALGNAGGARTYAESILGTGTAPDLTYPPPDAMQDGAYVAGYGRGALFANLGAVDPQFWDFGGVPARDGANGTWANPATYQGIASANLGMPFTHFAGREILAGTQRALWFYYTYGENPNAVFPAAGTFASQDDMRDAVLGFWDYTNNLMWDDTAGQAAWWESTGKLYKPCFSAGTDLPLGDWRGPNIDDKVHALNPDGSATVTVTGVEDEDFAYMSWSFAGIGVSAVDVVYSIDNGANWVTIPATGTGTTFTADIPASEIEAAETAGNIVYYYARAVDYFNNWSAFPVGSEVRETDGSIISQNIALSQTIGEVTAPVTDEDTASTGGVSVASAGQLAVGKSVNPPFGGPGMVATWTISLTNTGGSPLSNVSTVDNVPSGLVIENVTITNGSATVNGQQVNINVPTISPGETVIIAIDTLITPDAIGRVLINNVEGVSATLITVTQLPDTGERPWWAPCRWFGLCRD